MSGRFDTAITALQQRISELELEIVEAKQTINRLLKIDGLSPQYGDIDMQSSSGQSLTIQPDEFHRKPLATAVSGVLRMRKSLNQGPATVDEIYAALVTGGFEFDSRNESIAKRNVAISLGKNPKFHRLPNNYWGLSTWYKRDRKQKDQGEETENEETQDNEIMDDSIKPD